MEKVGFCWNSRRWLIGENPLSCPYESWEHCEGCGYYEERKPTKYLLRKLKIMKELFK